MPVEPTPMFSEKETSTTTTHAIICMIACVVVVDVKLWLNWTTNPDLWSFSCCYLQLKKIIYLWIKIYLKIK